MKYTIRKYNGDDNFSWAVFNVKYQAKPIVSGLSKLEAKHHKKILEQKSK